MVSVATQHICSIHFSPTRPSGPSWSVSRDVCLYVYVYVPFPCDFFRGLSLALRSHDQIPASDWSTLLPYHMVVVVVVVGGGLRKITQPLNFFLNFFSSSFSFFFLVDKNFLRPMRGLGSGHVTCGPMRGLEKNCMGRGHIYIYIHTHRNY